ncbi:MBL fold metallo-hydrolase [Capnocytophaga gingivalis]|uniref:MBL fold metallo-hydrolase n=1 Tax=Capnocytophaga gingivalis TaxID=1017 RepID=A0ABU5Y5H1_9FLAO|nr:MBL fold metallo-hydrolase [Capnocytophaga gingivalis]MEB3039178.1 MBL fold metallo-hydrolase [Capnocytophaga gingivalis]
MGIAKVISSGSEGNAVIYNNAIMVDCGVSLKALQEVKRSLKIVLLTHKHSDHLKIRTLQRLQAERPTLRVACGDFLLEELPCIKNIDVLQVGKIYDYGAFKVSPIKLYHDVPNFGWRIFLPNGQKIFHATDTAHLEGITAKGYDLYAIEHNYCEEYIQQAIEEARANGEYTHAYGNINTHLSIQQARAFIEANRKESSEVLELHKSRSFYK